MNCVTVLFHSAIYMYHMKFALYEYIFLQGMIPEDKVKVTSMHNIVVNIANVAWSGCTTAHTGEFLDSASNRSVMQHGSLLLMSYSFISARSGKRLGWRCRNPASSSCNSWSEIFSVAYLCRSVFLCRR